MAKKSAFKSDNVSKTFGDNLRKIRNEQGITLEKLGEDTGIASFHIGRLERGDSSANARTILKLCQGLRVNPNDLFKGLI